MAGESRKSLRGELEVVGEPVVKITGELTLGFATLLRGAVCQAGAEDRGRQLPGGFTHPENSSR